MHADMSESVIRVPRLYMARIEARQLPAELLLDGIEEFVEAPIVEHVFQPCLGAVGAVAAIDKHLTDRVGDFDRVARLQDDSGIPGEILVAGNAAEREAIIDAGRDRRAFANLHRLESDIVRIF